MGRFHQYSSPTKTPAKPPILTLALACVALPFKLASFQVKRHCRFFENRGSCVLGIRT
jgi:hypothetical protein